MDPVRPAPKAWTTARIVLTALGVVCLLAAAGFIVYGVALFLTVILLPIGLGLIAIGVALAVAGLSLIASPWVHFWWQRHKAREAKPAARRLAP